MYLLAIDPGVSTGWALYSDRNLIRAGACTSETFETCRVNASTGHAFIERPQIYRGSQSKADPNDLITLAVQVGVYTERLSRVGWLTITHVKPHEWKGSIPKSIHHARIWSALTPPEQAIVSDAGRGLSVKARGDMMDAIGLGKWACKRQG